LVQTLGEGERRMTEQEKTEILDELEQRFEQKYKGIVTRKDTQKQLANPRDKWFRDERNGGQNSLMTQALNGNSIVAWAVWEKIRTLTCYICGVSYVRQLKDEWNADEVAERLCQTVYDLAMERRASDDND